MGRWKDPHMPSPLLRKQGLPRTSDLYTIGAPRVVLTRLSTSGQLERVGRGRYRLPSNPMSKHEARKASDDDLWRHAKVCRARKSNASLPGGGFA